MPDRDDQYQIMRIFLYWKLKILELMSNYFEIINLKFGLDFQNIGQKKYEIKLNEL